MRALWRSLFLLAIASTAGAAERPNILWLTSEDHGPQMGCYGDPYATTPHVDALAKKGMRFRRVWSNAPVCAPARTTIITGMYPTSLGAEHMRSLVPLPRDVKLFPEYLREAGYYCTNNSKEDYNVRKQGRVWDESSPSAHWRRRAAGQPFFSVFNFTASHESQVRRRPHQALHDPAQAPLPAYYPDAPEIRQDIAQYYDKVTEVDAQAGQRLKELHDAGLAEDTIVFYFADHGPGLPRGKRWAGDSGLRAPLVVYFPDRWKHLAPRNYAPGAASEELVSFVDLAPTMLSLCGIAAQSFHQGVAFAGADRGPPRERLFGFRGRMDERMDMVRSVTDGRYVYLRNYYPDLPHGQHVAYQFETPTTQVWRRLFDEGKTNPEQSAFWRSPRSSEELYDLAHDPDEVRNLAGEPRAREVLERLRADLEAWQRETRDLGFMPEAAREASCAGQSPRDALQEGYPLDALLAAAKEAIDPTNRSWKALLASEDPTLRYWGVIGARRAGRLEEGDVHPKLRRLLDDPSMSVRIAAAEVLGRFGDDEDRRLALPALQELAHPPKQGVYAAMEAMAAIDALGDHAMPLLDAIEKAPLVDPKASDRLKDNVARLRESILERLRVKR